MPSGLHCVVNIKDLKKFSIWAAFCPETTVRTAPATPGLSKILLLSHVSQVLTACFKTQYFTRPITFKQCTHQRKFRLRWNDFKVNINTAFVSLRKDTNFTDVTLACEDGHQVDAHKVVLASSSPFFLNLLTRNRHPHSLIYMRGIKSQDVMAIVDFMYYGETNIYQENLDTFLNIAEELQLKGLNGANGDGGGDEDPPEETANSNTLMDAPQKKKGTDHAPAQIDSFSSESGLKVQVSSSMPVAHSKQQFSGNMQDLDEQIETMMASGDSMVKNGHRMRNGEWQMVKSYIRQVCGKEGLRANIKKHIETNHIEGIVIPCNLCEITFRSRDTLMKHNSRHHSNDNI